MTIKSELAFTKEDYVSVIDAIASGAIPQESLDVLITARIEMEDLEEKGIKELISFKERHIKILVRVDKKLAMPS